MQDADKPGRCGAAPSSTTQRTAWRLDFPGEQGSMHAGVMLQAVADEIATAAPDPLLILRNIRLTADQAWADRAYAATSAEKFTYVHSTFVQPAITCPGVKNEWTSNWVGLDGFNDATVEQDGTFAHCGGPQSTTPVYQAWYEMYPAGSVNVFRVHPGDVIDTSVTYAHGHFTLMVSDLTTGKTATNAAACVSCQRASAEWIIERPALCNKALTKCFLTRLADFGTSTMGGTEARVAGGTAKGIAGFLNYPINMVTPLSSGGFISLDTVGPLSGKTFTATWDRSGSTVPITLGPAG